MDIPQVSIELAKRFEGFHRVIIQQPIVTAVPYLCPAGYWTVGYGHLCAKEHPPIDEATGEDYLTADLRLALRATMRQCPVLMGESVSRLAAIVDFTFNLGAGRLQTSTLRRRINQRDWASSAKELRRWVYGGGKILPGLVSRREVEAQLLECKRPYGTQPIPQEPVS